MSKNLYDLALEAQHEGDIAKAIDYCQTLLKKKPEHLEGIILLGILYSQQKQWSNAIDCYEKAFAIDPTQENAFFNLAIAQLNDQQIEAAIENLKNTLKLNPNHAKAHRQLGQILQQREALEEAITHYKLSIENDPDHVDTYINLGAALLSSGNTLDAIQYFNKALVIDPQNFEAHYNLGATYLNTRNLDQALIHYISLLDSHASPEIYYNIGVIYMYQERQSDAIGFLRQAIEYDNDYFNAHVNLGVCYLKIDDIPKATYHYEIAHQLDPENEEITYLVDALEQNNNQSKAPKEYLCNLFDQYAPYFEQHLTEHLHYQSPKNLYEAVLKTLGTEKNDFVIVDLGCGTGLCGTLFKKLSKKLIGIDISPKMNIEAKAKNIYDEIITEDIQDALKTLKNNDIIIAGDVFTYIGDLDNIFSLVQQALNNNGIFAFTLEKQDESEKSDYHLQQTARFTHSPNYIHRLAKKHGFTINTEEEITLRTQNEKPLPGLVFALKK